MGFSEKGETLKVGVESRVKGISRNARDWAIQPRATSVALHFYTVALGGNDVWRERVKIHCSAVAGLILLAYKKQPRQNTDVTKSDTSTTRSHTNSSSQHIGHDIVICNRICIAYF
jgi:hypothetical protein